jgi:formylglycine-generating enzyme required for sulfatase activity
MAPSPTKICVACTADVSRHPRVKEQHGRYFCEACWVSENFQSPQMTAPASSDEVIDRSNLGPDLKASDDTPLMICSACGGAFSMEQPAEMKGRPLCEYCAALPKTPLSSIFVECVMAQLGRPLIAAIKRNFPATAFAWESLLGGIIGVLLLAAGFYCALAGSKGVIYLLAIALGFLLVVSAWKRSAHDGGGPWYLIRWAALPVAVCGSIIAAWRGHLEGWQNLHVLDMAEAFPALACGILTTVTARAFVQHRLMNPLHAIGIATLVLAWTRFQAPPSRPRPRFETNVELSQPQATPLGKMAQRSVKNRILTENQPPAARWAVVVDGQTQTGISPPPPPGDLSLAHRPLSHSSNGQPQSPSPKLETRSLDLGDGVKLNMVLIRAGAFAMGSPPGEKDRETSEVQHPVRLSKDFFITVVPVTQAQWKAIMRTNPSSFRGDDLPVETVSWNDATAFCLKLSQIAGSGFRLPTDAEWEYSCRAGSAAAYSFGDDPSELADYAWYIRNSGGKTHPVGTRRPNDWGLYDMEGNVWQWCSDWAGNYPNLPALDPTGPDQGETHILRGGSWGDASKASRAACRFGAPPRYRGNNIGFRVVETANSTSVPSQVQQAKSKTESFAAMQQAKARVAAAERTCLEKVHKTAIYKISQSIEVEAKRKLDEARAGGTAEQRRETSVAYFRCANTIKKLEEAAKEADPVLKAARHEEIMLQELQRVASRLAHGPSNATPSEFPRLPSIAQLPPFQTPFHIPGERMPEHASSSSLRERLRSKLRVSTSSQVMLVESLDAELSSGTRLVEILTDSARRAALARSPLAQELIAVYQNDPDAFARAEAQEPVHAVPLISPTVVAHLKKQIEEGARASDLVSDPYSRDLARDCPEIRSLIDEAARRNGE